MAQHALVTTQQFNDDQLAIIRSTVAKDTSPDQFRLFIEVCKYHGLSPFARQIYAVVRNSKQADGSYTKQMTIQTSIDGYRLLAERSGKYAGQVGPEWCGDDGVWKDVWLSDKPPAAARVGVLRKDFSQPTWGVAKYKSYAQSTPLWTKMPDVLLAKCAESLALRKAFPAEMSGIYTSEEMQQADSDHDHLPTVAPLHTNVVEADDSTSTRQNDNASISRQDENLTVLPSGNKSARQNSVVASSDSGASNAGHSDTRARINALYRLAVQKGQLAQGSKTDDLLKKCGDILKVTITSPVHLTPSRMDSVEKYLHSIGQPVEGEAQAVEA